MLTHQNSLFTSALKAHLPACGRDWKGGRSPLRSNGATSGTLESPSAAHIHKNEKNIFEKNLDVLTLFFYFTTICYLLNSEYDVKILATGLVLCARDFL